MDLLKKELERKKQAVAKAKEQTGGKSKYLKASDLRRLQEEQEEEERKRKHATKQEKEVSKKRPRTDDEEDVTKETPKQATTSKKNNIQLSSTEVTQQLRALGLPIHLFAENSTQQRQRLQDAMEQLQDVKAGLSEMDEFRLGSGHGIRNPFLGKKEDQESVVKQQEDTKQQEEEKQEEVVDDDDPHKRVYRFFKGLLKEWEQDLAARPESVKRTLAGKNETKTLKQCKDYIRPLFKLCKTRRLEESLLNKILKIVDYCEAGEFVKAHDAYMDVAIGRAAWPIGVTMVGIHARSGRAKIESSNVAHVMNSELQRKYLTSVKRLMTYCQSKRDDVAPSKKVMN